jgi:hypothetical protein
MGAMLCSKHGRSWLVFCCLEVRRAINRNRPLVGSKHGPRGLFRWCVCPSCFAARRPNETMLSSLKTKPIVCFECLREWGSKHGSISPGYRRANRQILEADTLCR